MKKCKNQTNTTLDRSISGANTSLMNCDVLEPIRFS